MCIENGRSCYTNPHPSTVLPTQGCAVPCGACVVVCAHFSSSLPPRHDVLFVAFNLPPWRGRDVVSYDYAGVLCGQDPVCQRPTLIPFETLKIVYTRFKKKHSPISILPLSF